MQKFIQNRFQRWDFCLIMLHFLTESAVNTYSCWIVTLILPNCISGVIIADGWNIIYLFCSLNLLRYVVTDFSSSSYYMNYCYCIITYFFQNRKKNLLRIIFKWDMIILVQDNRVVSGFGIIFSRSQQQVLRPVRNSYHDLQFCLK